MLAGIGTGNRAFLRARALKLPEVDGTMAAKDFLTAISLRLALEWARGELTSLIKDDELGRAGMTLEQYSVVSALAHENSPRKGSKAPGIFSTLGGRLDALLESASSSGNLAEYSCAYRELLADKHF
jgi:hypothetical protein